jgi:hypothetical protein
VRRQLTVVRHPDPPLPRQPHRHEAGPVVELGGTEVLDDAAEPERPHDRQRPDVGVELPLRSAPTRRPEIQQRPGVN